MPAGGDRHSAAYTTNVPAGTRYTFVTVKNAKLSLNMICREIRGVVFHLGIAELIPLFTSLNLCLLPLAA